MRQIEIPVSIEAALATRAALAISLSGGKDSQALLNVLTSEHQHRGWLGRLFAIHANLGLAEWPQTLAHCQRICSQAGVELVIVQRPKGDLVDRWRERMIALKGTGKPFWSSASNRYCTAEMKRDQIDRYLRQFDLVVSAEGVRADESPDREKKQPVSVRRRITTKLLQDLLPEDTLALDRSGRLAFTWYPLHAWHIDDVWAACGTSREDLDRRRELYRSGRTEKALDGWPCHPAYVLGNSRLSCALCVLASKEDLRNGARHNPELYRQLVEMERESGWRFRADLALSAILKEDES